MKTSFFDFFICLFWFFVMLTLSMTGVVYFVTPLSQVFLGPYHIIFDFFAFLFVYGLLSGMLVKTSLKNRPLTAGEFSFDHPAYANWKFITMVYLTAKAFLLPLTLVALRPAVYRLFGAKIGSDVAIGGTLDTPYLTTIGDGSAIGSGSFITGVMTVADKMIVGEVKIGKNTTLGMNAIVMPNVEIGDNAVVEIGSVVMPGSKIPAGEKWKGNPARKWM